MPCMTGGEAIVDGLLRCTIDTVFGLPDVQTQRLFHPVSKASNCLRLINARSEQTTADIEVCHETIKDRLAVYAVVLGRGVLNTTAALATAWDGKRARPVPDRPSAQHDE